MSEAHALLDLHRYVDARLAPVERRRLDAALADDAEAVRRLAAWQGDLDLLRQVFDPIAVEPLPLPRALVAREPLARAAHAPPGNTGALSPESSAQSLQPRERPRKRRGNPVAARLGGRQDRVFIAVSAFVIGAAAALAGAAAFGVMSGDAGALFGAFWRLPGLGRY